MINTYFVGVKQKPNWGLHVSAETPGKAKYQYLRHVQEAWEDVTFMDLTCHRVCKSEGKDPYEYVRNTYGVPAFVGGKATYLGTECEIARPSGGETSSAYVWLFYMGKICPFHPKESGLTYADEEVVTSP